MRSDLIILRQATNAALAKWRTIVDEADERGHFDSWDTDYEEATRTLIGALEDEGLLHRTATGEIAG